MTNEAEYVYVESKVERAWNIPVTNAQELLGMPGASADEMAAKLNAAFKDAGRSRRVAGGHVHLPRGW